MQSHSYTYDEAMTPAMPVADVRLISPHSQEDTGAIQAVEIGPHLLPGIHAAGVPSTIGIVLGRNVINQITLILNGPANVLEIPATE